MRSGQKWVIGLLALGACAGLFAVTYWKRPENSVRWSFTQIHTSLVRGKREAAIRFLAPRVTWEGRERSAADFLTAYTLPAKASDIEAAACPSTPGHWTVTMKDLRYCFVQQGNVWQLHWVEAATCSCK